LFSCGKEVAKEKACGPYKITKAELVTLDTFGNLLDTKVYDSDTVGYFLFYNTSPQTARIKIGYPSGILVTDMYGLWEFNEYNSEMLYLWNGSNITKLTVKNQNRKKQEWSRIYSTSDSTNTIETIYVEKNKD